MVANALILGSVAGGLAVSSGVAAFVLPRVLRAQPTPDPKAPTAGDSTNTEGRRSFATMAVVVASSAVVSAALEAPVVAPVAAVDEMTAAGDPPKTEEVVAMPLAAPMPASAARDEGQRVVATVIADDVAPAVAAIAMSAPAAAAADDGHHLLVSSTLDDLEPAWADEEQTKGVERTGMRSAVAGRLASLRAGFARLFRSKSTTSDRETDRSWTEAVLATDAEQAMSLAAGDGSTVSSHDEWDTARNVAEGAGEAQAIAAAAAERVSVEDDVALSPPQSTESIVAELSEPPRRDISDELTLSAQATRVDAVEASIGSNDHVLVERDRSDDEDDLGLPLRPLAGAASDKLDYAMSIIKDQLEQANQWISPAVLPVEETVSAEAIARADEHLREYAETPVFDRSTQTSSALAAAWAADYAEAGVDVSEDGRVRLLDTYGLLPDDALVEALTRVFLTDESAVVRTSALMLVAERPLGQFSDVVVECSAHEDSGERCAAVAALTSMKRVDVLTSCLEDVDFAVVSAAAVGLATIVGTDETRVLLEAAESRYREDALALVSLA